MESKCKFYINFCVIFLLIPYVYCFIEKIPQGFLDPETTCYQDNEVRTLTLGAVTREPLTRHRAQCEHRLIRNQFMLIHLELLVKNLTYENLYFGSLDLCTKNTNLVLDECFNTPSPKIVTPAVAKEVYYYVAEYENSIFRKMPIHEVLIYEVVTKPMKFEHYYNGSGPLQVIQNTTTCWKFIPPLTYAHPIPWNIADMHCEHHPHLLSGFPKDGPGIYSVEISVTHNTTIIETKLNLNSEEIQMHALMINITYNDDTLKITPVKEASLENSASVFYPPFFLLLVFIFNL